MKAAIICEGTGDKDFLKAFMTHLKIEATPNFYIFKGKSFILDATHGKYEELKSVVAAERHKLLFVVDADDVKNDVIYGGLENTQQALNQVVAGLEFKEVSSTYICATRQAKLAIWNR